MEIGGSWRTQNGIAAKECNLSHVPALITRITKRRGQLGDAIVAKEDDKFIQPAHKDDESDGLVSIKTLNMVLDFSRQINALPIKPNRHGP